MGDKGRRQTAFGLESDINGSKLKGTLNGPMETDETNQIADKTAENAVCKAGQPDSSRLIMENMCVGNLFDSRMTVKLELLLTALR